MILDLLPFNSNLHLIITLISKTPPKPKTKYLCALKDHPEAAIVLHPAIWLVFLFVQGCTEVVGHCNRFSLSWALPCHRLSPVTGWLNPILLLSTLWEMPWLVTGFLAVWSTSGLQSPFCVTQNNLHRVISCCSWVSLSAPVESQTLLGVFWMCV